MANSFSYESLETWDPLETQGSDPGLIIAAQRREIRNILKSYTGYYDLFSELLQNSLDAVERRAREEVVGYVPRVWVLIDMKSATVSVTDNGCGMDLTQFKQFLRPNFSFKEDRSSRGCKGVGATYLGYGFNHLEVATRHEGRTLSGILRRGREWVEDKTGTIPRPRVEHSTPPHKAFDKVDRGTSMTVKLTGADVRPRNLGWIGATSAETWLAVLRAMTPLGGIYLCQLVRPTVEIEVEVINSTSGDISSAQLNRPHYLLPHEVFSRVADLREYLKDEKRRLDRGLDVSKVPSKFLKLNGLWGEWTGDEILDSKGDCPIRPRLEPEEIKLVKELGIKLYIFMAFSTDLWDNFNDRQLNLRNGHRLLRGGLQLATRNMPQGLPLTIPMTNNIGFQNLAHVIVHFENAEPDLGRKGFQPEQVRVAEKLSVSAVTAFRRRYGMLRKPGGAKEYNDELKLNQWIRAQEDHEAKCPLVITGAGLFQPTEELAIRSEPIVEQDVVALFNQMLTSGLVRGIQLIASSQYKQYDGLYRVKMAPPLDRFTLSDPNPLGVEPEIFLETDSLTTVVKVIEYKYTMDGLIEEIQAGVKSPEDIGLAVAWEMGKQWQQIFDVISYLDKDNVHHRKIHGTTHAFVHAVSGANAFEVIILRDLVNFLKDSERESDRQRKIYTNLGE